MSWRDGQWDRGGCGAQCSGGGRIRQWDGGGWVGCLVNRRWLSSRNRQWEGGGCGGRDGKRDGRGNLQMETPNGVCVSLSWASLEAGMVPMGSVPSSEPKPTTTATYQDLLLPSPLPQLLRASPQPPQRRGSQAGTRPALPRNNTLSRAIFSYTNDFLFASL